MRVLGIGRPSVEQLTNDIVNAFDSLETTADRISLQVVKVETKLGNTKVRFKKQVRLTEEAFKKFINGAKAFFNRKVVKLEKIATKLHSDENKARVLAKNWKKVMLDQV
jgi:hypothetical protein